jgi:hypothetical protein
MVLMRSHSRLLAEEIATLQRHSVERFAFYSVPSMQGANVAYARASRQPRSARAKTGDLTSA